MEQLNALDNLMIEGELPNIPMQMSAAMLYETRGKRGANRLFDLLAGLLEDVIASQFPILRCKLEELPLQLDKAYWVEDANFSLTYHVNRVALPKPNNWQELYRLIGQFHAQPLDRSKPLWQILVVEGLDELSGIPRGSSALLLKIHHSVMDGKSALNLVSRLHASTPELESPTAQDPARAGNKGYKDYRSPTWWTKYARAWWHSIERPIDLISTLAKVIPGLLHSGNDDSRTEHHAIPHIRFNHPVAPDRVVGHVRMEMKTLRKLEKKHACTINDIAVCVIAGALRDFLEDLDELPDQDLQALMPVDVRHRNRDGDTGNHLSFARISLYTSLTSARQRLETITQGTSHSKKHSRKSESLALLELLDEIHPAVILWLGQRLVSSGYIDELPQLVNTIITNVPGMPHDAYLSGFKLLDYIGFGPLAPNMGLFHTVSSTQDHVNISFLSTDELIGDGSSYRKALERSFARTASA
jgi:diacylglycerol O-acyltransferase / wax synthase